jgi:hypothetical protein
MTFLDVPNSYGVRRYSTTYPELRFACKGLFTFYAYGVLIDEVFYAFWTLPYDTKNCVISIFYQHIMVFRYATFIYNPFGWGGMNRDKSKISTHHLGPLIQRVIYKCRFFLSPL